MDDFILVSYQSNQKQYNIFLVLIWILGRAFKRFWYDFLFFIRRRGRRLPASNKTQKNCGLHEYNRNLFRAGI